MYKWDAEKYEQSSLHQKKLAEEYLSGVTFRGNEKVLDIGCGDGKTAAFISSLLPSGHVTGIDYSPEMIDFASKNYPVSEYPNLSFRFLDAQNLDYSNEFDLIISFSCLHWVPNHDAVFKGIKASLKNGGRTFLQFGVKSEISPLYVASQIVFSSEIWIQYNKGAIYPFRFYELEEYKKIVDKSGLNPTRVEVVDKEMKYDSKDKLIAMFESVILPLTGNIPEKHRKELLDEMFKKLFLKFPLQKGKISVKLPRLEVEVEKLLDE